MAGRLSEAGGGPMTPQLAQAAAQSGAPPVGAEAGAGAPPPAPAPGAQAQTAAPSPEPAAPPPGAGAPPPGADPRAQQGARAGGGGGGGPAGAIEPYLQEADPQLQQEYARAIRSMAKVLYSNDQTANSIVDQIRPDNLVSDTAKVATIFIKELDRKINMDEGVIAEVTRESVERISELAEARHQIQYSMPDLEKILGATWEAVQSMYGNTDVEGFTQTVQGMRPEDLQALQQQQQQILNQG